MQIGKYTSENGNDAAVWRFSKDRPLNESTVFYQENYYQGLGKEWSLDDSLDEASVMSLPPKKHDRPLLLGDTIDSNVQSYIKVLRENGAAVTTSIAIATANDIISKVN